MEILQLNEKHKMPRVQELLQNVCSSVLVCPQTIMWKKASFVLDECEHTETLGFL
jgi:hypothetical protein